jgi:hypothetical protein
MAIEVELFDDLDAVGRDAAGALDRPSTPSLFDRLAWYRLTVEHGLVKGRPIVARADFEGARSWLFLSADGGRATGLTSWYSLLFGPVCRDGTGHALPQLAGRLRRQGLATLDLAPVLDPDALQLALRAAGWLVDVERATINWRTHTKGRSFDDYWAARPARLRSTVRRKQPKAGLDIHILSHFDADAWSEYESVYARSWKPAEGSPSFMRALAHMEGAAGTLRLGLAFKDGAPVAAQFWLVENDVATIHKLAHVSGLEPLSPGTLLTHAMFKHVIEHDRPEVIDFGNGDDGYKADWMDERRTLYRVRAYNPSTLLGLSAAMRARAGSLVRRLRSD